jgi:hypothetical protein
MADNREARSVRARRMIVEVESALETQSAAQVSTQFAEWQVEFPKLFEMVLTRTYDRNLMNMMLLHLEKVEQGISSQHDASIAVGTVLVDNIVKPQLNGGKK